MTATIQVRIDPKLKKEAQKVLKQLGLDMSSAINIYFRQITVTQGIPFQLSIVDSLTPKQKRKLLKEVEWARKHGRSYTSAEELHRDILGDY